MNSIRSKKSITLILFLINCTILYSQKPSYLDFKEYGFKQKFPANYETYYSSKIFPKETPLKALKYERESNNSILNAYLEIFKGECIDHNILFNNLEKQIKELNGNPNFFSDVKIEKYYDPFGWLVFKGTARKFSNYDYYVFLNVYLSKDYLVVVRSSLLGHDFWDTGYGINEDQSAESAFVPVPLKKELKNIGISLNMQGYFDIVANNELSGYIIYRCADKPNQHPNFSIYKLDKKVTDILNSRKLELWSNKFNVEGFDMQVKEPINWSKQAAHKFSNSEKSIYRYYSTFDDGNKYLVYENFYTFDFNGESYLVSASIVLNNDGTFRGYGKDSNFNNEYTAKIIMQTYEEKILKILETIQRL